MCGLSRASLLDLLSSLANSAPFAEVDDGGNVTYTVPRQRRFTPFRSEEIIPELPRKHARGNLPVLCYHLARAALTSTAGTTTESGGAPRVHQLPLFNRPDCDASSLRPPNAVAPRAPTGHI